MLAAAVEQEKLRLLNEERAKRIAETEAAEKRLREIKAAAEKEV